jgi:hypothetical protein
VESSVPSRPVPALVLLIGSTNTDWAWTMVQRSLLVGGLMGSTNGLAAGLVIV